MSITLYADGACKLDMLSIVGSRQKVRRYAESGPGGWAWWIDKSTFASGAVDHTTNNRMELQAVIEGLNFTRAQWPREKVVVVSDSQYVVKCFTDHWWESWERRNWHNANGRPVSNPDLWRELLDMYHTYPATLVFHHVRGHGRGGKEDAPFVHGNKKADELAVAARLSLEGGERREHQREHG